MKSGHFTTAHISSMCVIGRKKVVLHSEKILTETHHKYPLVLCLLYNRYNMIIWSQIIFVTALIVSQCFNSPWIRTLRIDTDSMLLFSLGQSRGSKSWILLTRLHCNCHCCLENYPYQPCRNQNYKSHQTDF